MACEVDERACLPNLESTEWEDFQTLFAQSGLHDHYESVQTDFHDGLMADLHSHTQSTLDASKWDSGVSGLDAPWQMQPGQNIWSDLQPGHASEFPIDPVGSPPFESMFPGREIDVKKRASLEACVHGPTKKKRHSRIPAAAKDVLSAYYAHTPYPSAKEHLALAQKTNLDVKTVRNWFSNTRVRHGDNGSARLSRSSLERLSQDFEQQANQLLPMDAWMNSLEDRLPVSDSYPPMLDPSQVAGQLQNMQSVGNHNGIDQSFTALMDGLNGINSTIANHQSIRQSRIQPRSKAPSISSSAAHSSAGSNGSKGTRASVSSKASIISSRRGRRRGRKRISVRRSHSKSKIDAASMHEASLQWNSITKENPNLASGDIASFPLETKPKGDVQVKPYFCTFCGNDFKGHYDWLRHEESIHVPQTVWICGSASEANATRCPYCIALEPDQDHLDSHNHSECISKPAKDRTFYRRDQFVQHLHNAHLGKSKHPDSAFGCTKGSDFGCNILVEASKCAGPPLASHDPALHCGFCGEWFDTWQLRSSHVANYFRTKTRSDLLSWWAQRKPHTLRQGTPPAASQFKECLYCNQIYHPEWSHESCGVWSCRFLDNIQSLQITDIFGDRTLPAFVTPEYFSSYRGCDQEFFPTFEAFVNHLRKSHGANDAACCDSHDEMQKNFFQMKVAIFEPAR